MNLVAYLRHSKRDKNGQSLSFEYQLQQIKRFISSQEGWRLVRIFKDDGYSGALPVEKRPGLKALQEYCKNHRVKKVIVFKLDRLFREARLALNFAWELGEQEIGLVATQEIIDTSTPWGKFSRYMQIGVAELERDIISTRTIAALNVKKERLEHLGHVPFGFTRKKGKLIPEPIEQGHLERMRKLRSQGLSYEKVAEKMNKLGIPTHQRAKQWYGSTVNKVLHQRSLKQFLNQEKRGGE